MEGLFLWPISRAQGAPEDRIFTGLSRDLSFYGDNRFIAGIALH
jgi:hypothetical protein